MSLNEHRGIALQLASGKPTRLPAMKMSDFIQILWWLDFLQGRPL
ncbi:hypothetical protein DFO55_1504 [Grimontella sp. AG753]|nr:hypothetical protein DFO55_1504 [Grimontella sp. AG753]